MAGSRKPHVEVHFSAMKGPDGNGMRSLTTTATPRGGQGGGPSFDREEEETFHPTMGHAVKHLKTSMAHCFENAPEKEAVGKALETEEE